MIENIKIAELEILASYQAGKYVLAQFNNQVGIYAKISREDAYQIDDDCNAEMAHNGLFAYRVEQHKSQVADVIRER